MKPAKFFAVIPAAGIGRRVGGDRPKQYLEIAGRTVLEWTVSRIATFERVRRVVIPVAADDDYFTPLACRLPAKCSAVVGGAERCHSVLNGLDALAGEAAPDDWVLVHDAARPCVQESEIERLIGELENHDCGGLLGVPVRDTLKRCDAQGSVVDTLDRTGLWQAQTPQMFRFALLRSSLEAALADGALVTDEAQAVERAGHRPRVVLGHTDNLKITHPDDLEAANRILQTGYEV